MKKPTGTAALITATCLSLMPPVPAYAANWVYVSTDKDNAVNYYDSETIRRSGNQVTVWEKVDFSRDKTVKERVKKIRYRYDCSERTATLLQMIIYYPDGSNETITLEAYEQKAGALAPETVGEMMLEAVCR